MARNRIQFQKGLSEAQFQGLYGDEERCWSQVVAWRWPKGFECPACGCNAHCLIEAHGGRHGTPRKLFQCSACRKQTSVSGAPTPRCRFDAGPAIVGAWRAIDTTIVMTIVTSLRLCGRGGWRS